jgi:alpha,alpha-trehalase
MALTFLFKQTNPVPFMNPFQVFSKTRFSLTLFLMLILNALFFSNCKNTPPETRQAMAINPLSIRDPKVNLSPDERFGSLFDSVQTSTLFPDSKTFVDYTPTTTSDSIVTLFHEAVQKPNFSLEKFVSQYFIAPKSPTDTYKSDVSKSAQAHITELWSVLSRPADEPNLGTLIPLPKPYIVPGGRFREIYYWDSYFTMLGLQASGRVDLIENMIQNFAHLINTEGFIPNGNRTYYLSRSQPPFFAAMVQLLAEEKGDKVLITYLPQLEKEYAFWMDGAEKDAPKELRTKRRVIQIEKNTLNRYCDDSHKPRPEGYKEDIKTAKESLRPEAETYKHLRSGAESGWDFSSRWFDDGKTIGTIATTDIIPIDLNALLYNLEMTISQAKAVQKKYDEATEWEKKASQRRNALNRYCWSETKGMFFDFNVQKYKQTPIISAAMAFPLYFKMVNKRDADRVAAAIQEHLLRPGGIIATTQNTGEQWDAPNGWAPLQWIVIKGLRNYGHDDLANDIKKRWLDLNVKVYKATGKMLEKYNVEDLSLESGGGEYPVQDGFGWTNGVLLKLLSEK